MAISSDQEAAEFSEDFIILQSLFLIICKIFELILYKNLLPAGTKLDFKHSPTAPVCAPID